MATDESLFLKPGYIPTADDVAAYIEEHGQWGALPKLPLCKGCGFPLIGEELCYVCNAPIPGAQ